jgi:asparagine synthase (glutamine-hydrolysing)
MRKLAYQVSSLTALSGDSKASVLSRKLRDFSKIASLPSDEAFMQEFSYFDMKMKSLLLTPDFYGEINEHDSNSVFKKYYSSDIKGSQLFKRQLGDIKTTLADEMLKKVDNMTMAVSLEARTPFLDYRMAEFSATLPDYMKIQGREGKWVVKKSMEKYLSPEILYRKKHGFNIPFSKWAKKELNAYLKEVFSESNIKESNIFNYKQISKILSLHQSGKYDYGNHIYMLLVFELWRRQNIS